jgi:type 1 glutamine amidotransferase
LLAVILLAFAVSASATAEHLRVVFVSGSFLYESDAVLTKYKAWLEANYSATVTLVSAKDWDDLPGLEALDRCDVALFYTRRLKIDGEQLQRIRHYVASGKPVVAVRTASHGFENWPEFDRDVLGGDYQRHFPEGPVTKVTLESSHPVLKDVTPFESPSSLYRNPEINPDCNVLLRGTTSDGTQPVAWTRDRNPDRVFYTSLGTADDFAQDSFKRLIANALYWAASLEAPEPPSSDGASSEAASGTSVSDNK